MDEQQGEQNQQQSQMGQEAHASTQHQSRMVMGILAYIGILIVIPFLMDKEDPFVKFHIKQGLILFIVEVIVWVILYTGFLAMLWPLIQLINLALLILAILGIVNVVQNKQQE